MEKENFIEIGKIEDEKRGKGQREKEKSWYIEYWERDIMFMHSQVQCFADTLFARLSKVNFGKSIMKQNLNIFSLVVSISCKNNSTIHI